ncbi:Protoporphyrinogen oxidase [Sphingobium faniae]|nr:Protoporphyrinogen oxidase [Sphingobium faniae]
MKTKHALVVGAGLSGLAAAYHLKKNGWQVTVLEKSSHIGGRVMTKHRDGFVIDVGPDAITTAYTEYLRIAEELGMSPHIVKSSPVIGFVRDGCIHDVDTSSLMKAAVSPFISYASKLRFAAGMWRMRKDINKTDMFNLVDQAQHDRPDVNAHDEACHYFGRELADYLIDPLVRLVVGTSSDRASLLSVRGVLSTWSHPIINIAGGLAALPDRLSQGIDVTLGVEVTEIERRNGSVGATWRAADGTLNNGEFEGVVISAQIDAAAKMSKDIADLLGDDEQAIGALALMTISMAFEKPTKSNAYAIQLPSVEHPDELLMFFEHNKAPDRAPSGKSLITYYIDDRTARDHFRLTDNEVIHRAKDLIYRLAPELEGAFLFAQIERWERAGSLAMPGYYRIVQKITNRLDQLKSIYLAGDFYSAGSMETALRTGRLAASKLISDRMAGT